MQAQVISSSSKEVHLSIKESDVATLYIIQYELLKDSGIDFAGVIVKHPLTNECWMKVTTTKNSPLEEITKASASAIKISEDLKKLFHSKIKCEL